MNIVSFKLLTTLIGWLSYYGPIPALTIFDVYALMSSYGDANIERFCVKLEKFFRLDYALKVTTDDFDAKVGPRKRPKESHIGTHGLE